MQKLKEGTREYLIWAIKTCLSTLKDRDLINLYGTIYYPPRLTDKDYEGETIKVSDDVGGEWEDWMGGGE